MLKTAGLAEMTLLLLIILPSSAYSFSASAEGRCRDFTISIEHEAEGCFDVKIDAPAQVLHEDGWKDSFFYVPNALCDGTAEIRIRMSTSESTTATIKLRRNSTILQQPLEIAQQCAAVPQNIFFPVVLIVIAVLLSLVWWEMKR